MRGNGGGKTENRELEHAEQQGARNEPGYDDGGAMLNMGNSGVSNPVIDRALFDANSGASGGAVEENLQRYRILAMHARDIVLLFDREGLLLEANDAAVKAYGYSHEQLIGLRVNDLRAPETAEIIRAQMAQAGIFRAVRTAGDDQAHDRGAGGAAHRGRTDPRQR